MENNVQTTNPEVQALVDSAFVKGLVAVILIIAEIPLPAPIFSILLGSKALKMVDSASALAAQYGQTVCRKCIAAKILGKVGKIAGIAMTAFWSFFFSIFIIMIVVSIVAGVMSSM